jgi:hypothetical protein
MVLKIVNSDLEVLSLSSVTAGHSRITPQAREKYFIFTSFGIRFAEIVIILEWKCRAHYQLSAT